MAVETRPGGARHRNTGRHLRAAVTLLVLLGFVSFAALYGWRAITGDAAEEDAAAQQCLPAAPADGPPPGEVQVNVYNATTRSGLASSTAGQLRERGFVILDVANDPLARQIDATAEVRANPAQQAAANVVLAQLPDAVFVPDQRAEPTIDLVLGDAFQSLAVPLAPEPDPAAEGEAPPEADPEAPAAADPSPTATALPLC
jgi:LytR cell envelope-related transcriptional attenuator